LGSRRLFYSERSWTPSGVYTEENCRAGNDNQFLHGLDVVIRVFIHIDGKWIFLSDDQQRGRGELRQRVMRQIRASTRRYDCTDSLRQSAEALIAAPAPMLTPK
jgi:hypothetical protein